MNFDSTVQVEVVVEKVIVFVDGRGGAHSQLISFDSVTESWSVLS